MGSDDAPAADATAARMIGSLPAQPGPFASNKVQTTKYSLVPIFLDFFLWKMLYEQFQRKANIYFLIVGCLQLVPGLSPTGRFTTITTLVAVLTFSMLKSGYEDFQRYKKDKEVNGRSAFVLRSESGTVEKAKWTRVSYTEVCVGDIIRVANIDDLHGRRHNDIPCDIAVLATSDNDGTCFVETANLDGETNLKPRRALEHTQISALLLNSHASSFACASQSFHSKIGASKSAEYTTSHSIDRTSTGEPSVEVAATQRQDLKAVAKAAFLRYQGLRMESEQPNGSLYTFSGNFLLGGGSNHGPGDTPDGSPAVAEGPIKKVPVSPDQMLYRGCLLRKVHWIVGVVVFTGAETKVMMNARKPPHKASHVERVVNKLLLSVLGLQLLLCVLCAVGLGVSDNSQWYLQEQGTSALERSLLGFLTFVILFNNFIPISLYVSLELIKFFQGRMLEQDICMYYAPKKMPAQAKSTDLNEELGQVNFVFSDKTGTLTRNIMTFMKFCIDGEIYGSGTTEIGRAAAMRQGKEVVDNRPPEVITSDFPFYDDRVTDERWMHLKCADKIRDFFTLLAVCHTVVIDNGKLEAESPDEEALVKAAANFEYRLVNRTTERLTIHVGAAQAAETFELLEVVEFNSDRKRMSLLVQDPDGKYRLMTKGADNIMIERLREEDKVGIQSTISALRTFGEEGLRTLVLAQRILSEEEATSWTKRAKDARAIIGDDRRKKDLLAQLGEEIEVELQLVGCTAIEDKLQENVSSVIESLRRATIGVWMLTGDKVETAINIAHACALLQMGMRVIRIVEEDKDHAILSLLSSRGEIEGTADGATSPVGKEEDGNTGATPAAPESEAEMSIVIDGASLAVILASEELMDKFYDVAKLCTSVVCCRVSPKQKAQVVSIVRDRSPAITLAIGDGANDVPMIQAAHVGVGISGMEGQQAANSADYAIGQFKHLHRLVMVHGRVNYYRLTTTINYFFYKNALLVMTQFWYCFFNQFTGQSLYEKWSLSMYNLAWTALPVIVFGVFDRDVLNTDNIHQWPLLYMPGISNEFLNTPLFLRWQFAAIVHSLACFFLVMHGWGDHVDSKGFTFGLDGSGVTIFTCVIVVANLKLALHMNSFSWLHHLFLWGTIASWFLFLAFYGVFPVTFSTTMYGILGNVGAETTPYMYFLLALAIALCPDFMTKFSRYRLLALQLLYIVQFKDSEDPRAATRAPKEAPRKRIRAAEMVSGSALIGVSVAEEEEEDEEEAGVALGQDVIMQFIDPDLEEEFIERHIGTLGRYKAGIIMCAIGSLVLVGFMAYQRDTVSLIEILMWALFSLASWILLLLLVCTDIKESLHQAMLLLTFLAFSGMSIANLRASQREPDTHPVTMGVILLGLLGVVRPPLLHAIHYVFIAFVCYVLWYQAFPVREWYGAELSVRFFELATVAITSLISLALTERFGRKMFISHKKVLRVHESMKREGQRSLMLLGNVLPSTVVHEVQVNKRHLSQFSMTFPEASTLNSDIVKFTEFSSTREPHVVVEMLNKMFTKFDAHANLLDLEKIKTIGDAYICGAGIPLPDPRHHEKIIAMGLRMIDSVKELNEEGLSTQRELNIRIRVGCATGEVKTGVVGLDKMCFDIFGECAEMSEKMEQQGVPCRVHVSERLFKATEHLFDYDVTDGKYLLVENTSRELLENDSSSRGEMPIVSASAVEEGSSTMDVYGFLQDDDQDRAQVISTWSGFDGSMAYFSLTFSLERAEADFRQYLKSLAKPRFTVEASQATYIFLSCVVLLALTYSSVTHHSLIPVLVVVGLVHLLAAIINHLLSAAETKRKGAVVSFNDSDSDSGDDDGGDVFKRRQSSAVVNKETSGEGDPGAGVAKQAFSGASIIIALLVPILVLILLDDIRTTTVFVVLAVNSYILMTLHLRMTGKLILALIHFVIVSGSFYYSMTTEDGLETSRDGGNFFAIIICYVLSYLGAYFMESNVRLSYYAAKDHVYHQAEVEAATALCDKLLRNALPSVIVDRMRQAPDQQIVDEVDDASVMFIYSEGLAIESSQEHTTQQQVDRLNAVLSMLDSLASSHGLEKIKTSPYLLVCGCPEPRTDHAERMVMYARDVIEEIVRYNEGEGTAIKLRVGIHSGRVTAGVLGATKFIYDVFGDTVNFASRLTSSADWGEIQLSNEAAKRVRDRFSVISRGTIELKGKGKQDVFLVDKECDALKNVMKNSSSGSMYPKTGSNRNLPRVPSVMIPQMSSNESQSPPPAPAPAPAATTQSVTPQEQQLGDLVAASFSTTSL